MGGVGINVPIQFIDVFWGEGCSWEMAMSVQDKRMKKNKNKKLGIRLFVLGITSLLEG